MNSNDQEYQRFAARTAFVVSIIAAAIVAFAMWSAINAIGEVQKQMQELTKKVDARPVSGKILGAAGPGKWQDVKAGGHTGTQPRGTIKDYPHVANHKAQGPDPVTKVIQKVLIAGMEAAEKIKRGISYCTRPHVHLDRSPRMVCRKHHVDHEWDKLTHEIMSPAPKGAKNMLWYNGSSFTTLEGKPVTDEGSNFVNVAAPTPVATPVAKRQWSAHRCWLADDDRSHRHYHNGGRWYTCRSEICPHLL